MRVSKFRTRLGAEVQLAKHQEIALERAGVWRTLGYIFITQLEGKATYSDAEIASMLGDYVRMTRVGMFHPQHRSPAHPWHVRHPIHGLSDAACPSFRSAVDIASTLFGCDIVTIPVRDMQYEFLHDAEECRVILLIV